MPVRKSRHTLILASMLGATAFCSLPGGAIGQSLMSFAGDPALLRAGAISPEPMVSGAGRAASLEEVTDRASPSHDVDLSGLRYFARTGDRESYEYEMHRLQNAYPGWTPPADPLEAPGVQDEWLDEMWALYGEGDLEALNAEITRRSSSEPGWAVPEDLDNALMIAEKRAQLVAASDLRQFERVLILAGQAEAMLTCDDVDVLWRVAEAYAETGEKARARDAYVFIMHNCGSADARIATARKATLFLDRAMLEDLFEAGSLSSEGEGELEDIRNEVARNVVMMAGSDESITVRDDDLERMISMAEEDGKADDSALLGWYFIQLEDLSEAAYWFGRAYDTGASASSAQGLALIAIRSGDLSAAEDVMYPWRDDSPEAHDVYMATVSNLLSNDPRGDIPEDMLRCLDPVRDVLSDTVLGRIAPEIVEAADIAAAQNMGWYAYAFGRHEVAGRWFSLALEWDRDHEPSAYGLALSLSRLGDTKSVTAIQKIWEGRSVRIARLAEVCDESGRLTVASSDGMEAARVREAGLTQPLMPSTYTGTGTGVETVATRPAARVTASTGTVRKAAGQGAKAALPAPKTVSMAPARTAPSSGGSPGLSQAWALMEANRTQEAIPHFKASLNSSSSPVRSDAAYGLSLAYMRLGMPQEAAMAANRAPQGAKRTAEMQVQLLESQAYAAYQSGQYAQAVNALDARSRLAPEGIGLMVLRGWSYQNLGRHDEARRVCEAAMNSGSSDGAECYRVADRAYWGKKRAMAK